MYRWCELLSLRKHEIDAFPDVAWNYLCESAYALFVCRMRGEADRDHVIRVFCEIFNRTDFYVEKSPVVLRQ